MCSRVRKAVASGGVEKQRGQERMLRTCHMRRRRGGGSAQASLQSSAFAFGVHKCWRAAQLEAFWPVCLFRALSGWRPALGCADRTCSHGGGSAGAPRRCGGLTRSHHWPARRRPVSGGPGAQGVLQRPSERRPPGRRPRCGCYPAAAGAAAAARRRGLGGPRLLALAAACRLVGPRHRVGRRAPGRAAPGPQDAGRRGHHRG